VYSRKVVAAGVVADVDASKGGPETCLDGDDTAMVAYICEKQAKFCISLSYDRHILVFPIIVGLPAAFTDGWSPQKLSS
jgi:hypothetical protein